MKSRISFFNFGLLRKNAVRFSPIWIGYLICWTVAVPVILAMQLTDEHNLDMKTYLDVAAFLGHLLTAGAVVTFVYGIIVAMAVWSYLYNARSVSLMHALPIRRSGLFLTNYVSGLLFIIVPHLIVAFLTLIVSAMAGAAAPGMTLTWFLGMSAMGIFFYSFATFIAMFTGHILALPVFYGIYNFLVIVLYFTIESFIGPFLYGINGVGLGGETIVEWLTPVIKLLSGVFITTSYEGILDADSSVAFNKLQDVTLYGGELFLIYAVVGILLAVLSYAVYRTHKSETAGDVVCVGWAKVVFRYGVALTAAFTIGQGLYHLLIPYGDVHNVAVELICMILVGVLGFVIAVMLLNKTFHVIRKSARGSVICTAAILLVFVASYFDVFGITKYIPEADDVQSVSLSVGAYNYSEAVLKEPENMEKVVELHRYLVDHRKDIQNSDWRWELGEEIDGQITLRYVMKDGSSVARSYRMMITKADFENEDSASSKLKHIVDTKEYRGSDLLGIMMDAEHEPLRAAFTYYEKNESDAMSERMISDKDTKVLYKALLEDINAGRIHKINLIDESQTEEYANSLELIGKEVDDHSAVYRKNIRLETDMTSTIAALKKLNILNDRVGLSLSSELHPSDDETIAYEAAVEAETTYTMIPKAEKTVQVTTFSTQVEHF